MENHVLPKVEEIQSAAKMLYGNDSSVNDADCLGEGDVAFFGLFLNDEDKPVAGIACDLSCAAYAGSALSMIPKGGADDAIQSNELTEMMLGNLNEFMNICSRWFMDSNSPHIRLDRTYPLDALDDTARQLLGCDRKVGMAIEIPNYGGGKITCCAL